MTDRAHVLDALGTVYDPELDEPITSLRFVSASLPGSYEIVRQSFQKKGAYSRLKALLARTGQLEAWYEYERQATEEALRVWSEENGLVLDRGPGNDGA